jgi:hypothetical protein
MLMDFCTHCGEYHPSGYCPEFGFPPPSPPVKREWAPEHTPPVPVPAKETSHETADHQAAQSPQKARPAAVAQNQRCEIFPTTKFLPLEGRPFTPDDMKQEFLPARQYFKAVRPRFDKRAYMRELMRKRRARPSP